MNLKKKKSRADGFGIFAEEKITKGTEFYEIPLDIIYDKPKQRCARIGENKYVDDNRVLNWVNHSCNPNTKLDINRDKPALIALRDIETGEEITVDYNRTELHDTKIKCSCGAKNCRGYFYISD